MKVLFGILDRIDHPVSDVVFSARTSKALERLNQIVQNCQWEKV